MIAKISLFFVLPMLILSFFLALAGVQHISLNDSYYHFIQSVSGYFDSWKLEIPNIPRLNLVDKESLQSSTVILRVILFLYNLLFRFINIFIGLLNFVINILNVLIQLVQFILTIIYACKDFIGRVSEVAFL